MDSYKCILVVFRLFISFLTKFSMTIRKVRKLGHNTMWFKKKKKLKTYLQDYVKAIDGKGCLKTR